MVGDRDKQVSVEESKWAFEHLPNASLAVLPYTDHPFEKVNKEMLLLLIHNFLKNYE